MINHSYCLLLATFRYDQHDRSLMISMIQHISTIRCPLVNQLITSFPTLNHQGFQSCEAESSALQVNSVETPAGWLVANRNRWQATRVANLDITKNWNCQQQGQNNHCSLIGHVVMAVGTKKSDVVATKGRAPQLSQKSTLHGLGPGLVTTFLYRGVDVKKSATKRKRYCGRS